MLEKFFRKFSSKNEDEVDDLRSARDRLELALESANMVDWDFDYVKNTAHRGLKHDELYGYKEMLPTWNFDNFYHHVLPEFHEIARKKFEHLTIADEMSFDFKIRRVDGEIRWISLMGRARRNKNGDLVRVAGVLKDITAEKDLELKMKLQNMNMSSLFSKAPEFFCVLGPTLVYEFTNPAHRELFQGRDMTGQSVEEAQPELRDSEFVASLRRILKTGETVIFRDSPAMIGERLRYLDMVYAPRRNARNEIDGIMVLGADVSDKVTALKRAEQSEAQMRLITDKLPAFISYTDPSGRYRFMNKMYEKWFETPISEMIGKTREEITPPEYSQESKPFESQTLKGSASHHEAIIRKPNGEYMNLDVNFVPDVDPKTKEVRGMVAVGVDITERMKAHKEADLARKELHEVFMQAPAPMCLLSGSDYVFTMANPLYVEMVGREVLGKTLKEVFEGEDIKIYENIINTVYRTGEPYLIKQAPLDLFTNGVMSRRYVNVGYHAYKDAENKVKGVLVIVIDVTDQVNSVVARDNFISIASHELKTPLSTVKLQMQLNLRKLKKEGMKAFTAERLEEIFTSSDLQVDRVVRLVNDMLDGSQLSSDNLYMKFAPVNFSKLTKDVIANYTPELKDVGIDVNVNIQDDVVLKMDETRIAQIISNLLTNAIKYAPEKPLHVELRKEGAEALLRVRDEGMGIDPKFHEKIFERFERVDSSTTISGLGLGLYISSEIAKRHGGQIHVAAQLGKGSEFTLKLPLA